MQILFAGFWSPKDSVAFIGYMPYQSGILLTFLLNVLAPGRVIKGCGARENEALVIVP